ncbi:MAG TPA: AraC family transcriptional regulator [Polyangiales bacterium]|nr:AraC family transcriptional regulator [Polyangiales bacterium]
MQQLTAPRRLERFVRGLRRFEASDLPDSYRRLPDGETELLVRVERGKTSAAVVGTRTSAFEKLAQNPGASLLVRFRLGGAHPFFGRPMSELTDQHVLLPELWPSELRAQLEAAEDMEGAVTATLAGLVAALEREDAYDPQSARAVRRALRVIDEAEALPRIPQLAAAIGVSERQLRRGFDHTVGLSPKQYLRIVRFRRALRAARAAGRPDWAAIAEQTGYFDQAHLIAEFREFSGVTPAVLLG